MTYPANSTHQTLGDNFVRFNRFSFTAGKRTEFPMKRAFSTAPCDIFVCVSSQICIMLIVWFEILYGTHFSCGGNFRRWQADASPHCQLYSVHFAHRNCKLAVSYQSHFEQVRSYSSVRLTPDINARTDAATANQSFVLMTCCIHCVFGTPRLVVLLFSRSALHGADNRITS